jgi:uncharacterized cupin superfamily protein
MSMHRGEGWAVAGLDDMGSGPGFRKVRHALDVTAFGVNAVVLPPGHTSQLHAHERQEEVYFVHEGTVEIRFGDGVAHTLAPGGMARVDPATPRSLHNPGTQDAVYVCFGGAGGYVGRDGVRVEA